MSRVGLSSFVVFFSMFCFHGALRGQVTDEFNDGNFDQLPEWTSSQTTEANDYVVVDERLRSNGPAASASIWISASGTPTYVDGLLTWQFDIEYSHAPSGSNNIRIFFGSDKGDLLGDPAGYFIQLGESGSDDGIDFYKTSSSDPLILDSEPSVATAIKLTIRLTRTEAAEWALYKKEIQSENFVRVGSVIDAEIDLGDHFGFLVNHTSSRNESFFFDNVVLPFPDIVPPSLVDFKVVGDRSVILEFSDELEPTSVNNPINYHLSGIGNPISVDLQNKEVSIQFTHSFDNATDYVLTVSNISDVNGNIIENTEAEFFYFQQPTIEFRDIIITEFFADPSPPNDLPESEFIEIYNRSDKIFNLENFRLEDLSTSSALPDAFIFPNEYIIICPIESVEQYSVFGKTVGLDPFPTLNNNGDAIVLKKDATGIIDSLNYDFSWYRSSQKEEGGWSVEMIDLNNECAQESNWVASEDFRGGTPGMQNSVFAEKPDLTGPEVVSITAFSQDTVQVTFNEILDQASIHSADYTILPELPIDSVILSANKRELKLFLLNPLKSGVLYKLIITGIKDCPGNIITPLEVPFALIEKAEQGDIILNEVLFDPYPNGADFVEVFNTSDKYINLKHWFLANVERTGSELVAINFRAITSENLIIAPKEYMVFTVEDNLRDFYSSIDESKVVELGSLPSMPNNEGSIGLVLPDSSILDVLEYEADFHFELLADKEGVSLERISTRTTTNTSSNWASAASTVGFATPGVRNSQSVNTAISGDAISIEPKVIIPDGSGQNDFATINYQFDQPGNVANVRIYDMHGREIVLLANNETLASDGFFTWNGLDDRGVKARTGYYIVYFEVFDSSGNVSKYKEKVVVGTRF